MTPEQHSCDDFGNDESVGYAVSHFEELFSSMFREHPNDETVLSGYGYGYGDGIFHMHVENSEWVKGF